MSERSTIRRYKLAMTAPAFVSWLQEFTRFAYLAFPVGNDDEHPVFVPASLGYSAPERIPDLLHLDLDGDLLLSSRPGRPGRPGINHSLTGVRVTILRGADHIKVEATQCAQSAARYFDMVTDGLGTLEQDLREWEAQEEPVVVKVDYSRTPYEWLYGRWLEAQGRSPSKYAFLQANESDFREYYRGYCDTRGKPAILLEPVRVENGRERIGPNVLRAMKEGLDRQIAKNVPIRA